MQKRHYIGIALVCILIAMLTLTVLSADHREGINDLPNDVLYAQALDVDDIGPVLAGRIVTYRNQNKPIKISDLDNVPGIGGKRLSLLKKKLK